MLRTMIATLIIGFLGSGVFAQDYDKGLKAYNAGDYAAALEEWRPLAEQGYARAQNNLGWMYKFGTSVLKDTTEAVRWYRLAAAQGNASAQSNLGVMYANGRGVLKDTTMAHMWYNIASANGNEIAGKNRDNVEDDLTREQIDEATRWAKTCMASDYADCD